MFRPYLQLAFSISLALISLAFYSASVQTQPTILVSQTPPPPPPRTPPPDNRRVPGGGLDPTNPFCKKTNKSLTAFVPTKNPVLTTSEHPTFWFYVPYAPENINSGEFSLVTQDGKQRIYRASIKLPRVPGIVSISLPPSSEYALKEGEFYRWYLKLNCEPYTRSQPDLVVSGWVQRVALTPERQRQINTLTSDIWYDALTNLANRRLASPQDEALKNEWIRLLESAQLENFAQEPLVGAVQLSQK